jgi:hypothetical protein
MESDDIIAIERGAEKCKLSKTVGVRGFGHVVGGSAGFERFPSDAVVG